MPEWRLRNCGYEPSDPKSHTPNVASETQGISMPPLVPTSVERQPCFVRYWDKCPQAGIQTRVIISAGILIPLTAVALSLVWLLIQIFFGLI